MKKLTDWRDTTYNEEGDANRPSATLPFVISKYLYVEKDVCELPYCDEDYCDWLCWKLKWNKKNSEKIFVSPNGETLVDFIRLADETEPEKFAKKVELFAKKWGNLDLCKEHCSPSSHNYNCEPAIPHRQVVLRPVGVINEQEDEIYCESLAGWREYAVFAQSLLNIAANLQEGKIGEDKDWHNLHKFGYLGWSHVESRKEKGYQRNLIQFEKKLIAGGVNHWLAIGNLRPEITWGDDIVIVFKSASPYGSLFAFLAFQMMLAVGKQDGLAICSSCAAPYIPKRKPVDNRRRFCSECYRLKRPQRLASTDYRKRKIKI